MNLEAHPLSLKNLGKEIDNMKSNGWRFVTITCVEIDENSVELLYHFDKDLELYHFRVSALKKDPVPSISPIFFAAFLVENEIIDLFGLSFTDLVLDFGGTLYLDDSEVASTPLCKYGIKRK